MRDLVSLSIGQVHGSFYPDGSCGFAEDPHQLLIAFFTHDLKFFAQFCLQYGQRLLGREKVTGI